MWWEEGLVSHAVGLLGLHVDWPLERDCTESRRVSNDYNKPSKDELELRKVWPAVQNQGSLQGRNQSKN